MALSCFSVCTLHHIQASNKHSVVCHLWHPNLLLWHAFWRIVSPMTSTLSHKSDPRFGRNWEWNNPTSPVQCSFVKIWLSPWLGYEWKFAMAVTTQRNPSCEARFPWKNFRNQGAAGRITCKFTITSERKTGLPGFLRGAFSLEKTRNVGAITASHVNLQSPRRQDALSLKKHMESGRVSATHVLVEKRYGIRERLVACHMNLQSHWTQDAFYPRKHKESEPKECGRITARRIFVGKRQGMWARSTASHINLHSPWTQEALSFEKHMESGRVSATHVLVEKRYGIRERLVACHMNLQS